MKTLYTVWPKAILNNSGWIEDDTVNRYGPIGVYPSLELAQAAIAQMQKEGINPSTLIIALTQPIQ